jgi:pyruvate/2-oxoglutarate dehydrogenase complex dihydrolipoamide acyltransferase (E2) component
MIPLTLPDDAWEDVDPETEALIDRWLVSAGSVVSAGQLLAEVVLIKTNYEISAPSDGVLAEILVAEGDTFAKGKAIGQFRANDEQDGQTSAPPTAESQAPASDTASVAASDKASTSTLVPLHGLRGSVARAMTQAWQAPQVAIGVDVDMTRALAQRDTIRDQHQLGKLSITPLLIKAVARTLEAHKRVNALLTDKGIERHSDINIAVAVNVDDGLMTPVIRNANTLSIVQIHEELLHLVEQVRGNTLPSSSLQGGTFSISNLGMTGIDWFTPVLNPPQVAILGISQIAQRPAVRNNSLVVAPLLTLTLVFDHRAIDGYPAALFLGDLKSLLEENEID